LMPMFLAYATLEPGALVLAQGSQPWNWGVIGWGQFAASGAGAGAVPGLFGALAMMGAFVLFFTAAIAETKRAPFDIPEGEPEIIGYFVEYSGIRWGMFFLAEFIEIVFISAVIATVFFGGWQVPFLDADGFRIGGYMSQMTSGANPQFVSAGGWFLPLPH